MCIFNFKVVKIISIAIILIPISFIGKSQSDFKPGYYITLENDTVIGLLYNRGETGNFRSCTFKKDDNSAPTKFSASDIQGFRFDNGKYFIAKHINTTTGEETVFVEYLLNGISSLFFFRDPDNYRYIIENKEGRQYEIYNEEKIVYVEGKSQNTKNKNYAIRMLKSAFSDCMEIQPQVDKAQLNHKSLIKLTKNYHNYVCDDKECIVYEKKVSKTTIQIAPVIGFTTSNLSFDKGFYSRFSYEQNLRPTFGLQVNAALPNVTNGFSAQLDLMYHENNIYGVYRDYFELFVDNNMLQTSLLVKYGLPHGNIRPSIGVGLAGNFMLNTSIHALIDNTQGGSPQEQNVEDVVHLTPGLFGGVVQIGCNYHIFKNREMFTNFRYSITSGLANGGLDKIVTNLNTMNFNIGLYLSKTKN